MKKQLLLSSVLTILLISCGTKETPSGIKITTLRKGDGVPVKGGQYLVMNMTFKDGKDSVWSDSRKNTYPVVIVQVQDSVPSGDGVVEAFQMMTKGDSISFKVPAKTLFEKTFRQPVPPTVDSTSSFTFNIGLVDVLSYEQVQEFQGKLVAQQNEKIRLQQIEQLGKDTVAIDNFLKEKGIIVQKTKSGLRYQIHKKGTGANAQAGQTVMVNYSGYLLDGKFFDSSVEAVAKANNAYTEGKPYQPLQVTIGTQEVIKGWEEMLQLMNKGTKVTVYVPSPLGFGPNRRSDVIGENAITMFEMELMEIKK